MPTVRCNSNVTLQNILNIYLTLSGLAKGEKNYVESGLFKTPFRNSPLKKVLLCRLYRETLRRGSALDIVLNKGYLIHSSLLLSRIGLLIEILQRPLLFHTDCFRGSEI